MTHRLVAANLSLLVLFLVLVDVLSPFFVIFVMSAYVGFLVLLVVSETKDWKSPVVFLAPLSLLYYFVFPLYYYLGGERILNVATVDVDGVVSLSSLFILGLGFGYLIAPSTNSRGVINKKSYTMFVFGKLEAATLLFFFLSMFSYSFIQVLRSGVVSKSERMIEGTASFGVFFGGVYFCLGYLILHYYYLKDKLLVWPLLLVLVFGFLGFLFLGERDQLVLPFVFCSFVYGYIKRISIKAVAFSAIFVLLFLFVLGVYRGALESGHFRELGGLVYVLQENEFISAGRNVGIILSSDSEMLYGYTILGDFLAPFYAGNIPTGSGWFSANFIKNKGFSLVAESYANFGLFGVFFSGLLLASLMSLVYRLSFKNNIFTIAYVILLIASMYVLRSDLAAIPSAFIKKFLIPLILLLVLRLVVGKVFILNSKK